MKVDKLISQTIRHFLVDLWPVFETLDLGVVFLEFPGCETRIKSGEIGASIAYVWRILRNIKSGDKMGRNQLYSRGCRTGTLFWGKLGRNKLNGDALRLSSRRDWCSSSSIRFLIHVWSWFGFLFQILVKVLGCLFFSEVV